ncbi:MAG: hypothetical protein HYX61_05895 [Gammaproteobacteria bacterium]|nr:hypothetical protein [Gammaproteobacteria bacterium]
MSNKPTSTDDIENVEPQSKLEAFYDEVVAAAEGLANSFIKKAEARVPESLIPDEELLRYEAHNKISNKENEEVLIEQTFSNGNGHVIPRVKHDGHNASVKSSKQNLHQAISITITDEAAAKAIATNFGQNKTADFSNKIETKPLEHTEVTVRGHHPITKATHFIPQLHEAKAAHQAVVVVPGIIPVAVVPVPAPVHVVPVPVHVAPVPVHVVPVPVIPPAPVNNLAPVVPVVNNQQGGLLQGILGMLNNLRPTVIIHGNQPPLPAPVQVQIDPLVNNFVGDLVNPNPVPVPVHTIPAPITTAVGPDLTQVAPVQQDGGVLNIIGNFFHNLRPSVLATGNQEAEPVVKDLIQDMMLAEPSRTEQKDVPVPVAVDQFDPLVDDYVNDLFPNVIPNSVPVPKPLQEDKKDNGLQDADQEVDSFVDDMNKPAQSEQKESTKVEGTDTSATPDVAPVTTPVQPVGGLLDFLNGWRPSHLVTGTQRSAEKDLPLEQKSKMKIFAPELLDFDEQEIEDTDNQHMAEEMALGVLEDDDSEPTFKHVDPVDAFVGDMTGWSNPTPPTNGGSIWGPFALPKFTFGAKKQSPQSRTLTASEIEAVEDFVKDAVPTDSKTVSSLEPVQPQHDPLSVPVPQVDLSSGLLEQSGVRHLASTSLEDKSVQKFVKDITLKPEADATSLDTTKKADVQDFVQKIAEFVPVELDSLPTPNSSNHVDVETEQQENGTTTPDITHVPVLDESLHQPASLDAPVQIFVQDMFVGTKDPVEIPKNNVVISDEQPAELGSVSTPDLSKRVETEQQEDSSIVDELDYQKILLISVINNQLTQAVMLKQNNETIALPM